MTFLRRITHVNRAAWLSVFSIIFLCVASPALHAQEAEEYHEVSPKRAAEFLRCTEDRGWANVAGALGIAGGLSASWVVRRKARVISEGTAMWMVLRYGMYGALGAAVIGLGLIMGYAIACWDFVYL